MTVRHAHYILLSILSWCVPAPWVAAQVVTAAPESPSYRIASLQEAEDDAVPDEFDVPFYSAPSTYAPRCWARAEYLMWWTKGNELPPLVTTSPPTTDRDDAGVLGLPGTEILYGGHLIDHQLRSGLRISGGHWLDDEQTVGLEAVYFSVFDDAQSGDFLAMTDPTLAYGTGLPILARPFYNVRTGQEDSELVSFPNLLDGQIEVTSSSEMHSAAVLCRHLLRSGPRGRLDFIGGYRFFRYRETFQVREQLEATANSGVIVQGTTFDIRDRFATENDFHGGEFGLVLETEHGIWTTEFLVKVALGRIYRQIDISGSEVRALGGSQVVDQGGLLALPTNIGHYKTSDFASLPEFGVNLSLAATDHIQLNVGYTLLLLADVARSGDQVDRGINTSQLSGGNLTGEPRPQPTLADDADFWVQGINLGVVFEH